MENSCHVEMWQGVTNFLISDFLIFQKKKKTIQWFLYSGKIYVRIYNPYVRELCPVYIHMD